MTSYELHIRMTAGSREEVMAAALRAFDAVKDKAQHVTVHEETTMPVLKRIGSIGVSRG